MRGYSPKLYEIPDIYGGISDEKMLQVPNISLNKYIPQKVNVSTQTIPPYYSTIRWFTVFTPFMISIISTLIGSIFLEVIKKGKYIPSTGDFLLELIDFV